MCDITVNALKEKLQNIIDELDTYGDNEKIHAVSNTYFLDSNFFISIPRVGFVDLADIEPTYDDD